MAQWLGKSLLSAVIKKKGPSASGTSLRFNEKGRYLISLKRRMEGMVFAIQPKGERRVVCEPRGLEWGGEGAMRGGGVASCAGRPREKAWQAREKDAIPAKSEKGRQRSHYFGRRREAAVPPIKKGVSVLCMIGGGKSRGKGERHGESHPLGNLWKEQRTAYSILEKRKDVSSYEHGILVSKGDEKERERGSNERSKENLASRSAQTAIQEK